VLLTPDYEPVSPSGGELTLVPVNPTLHADCGGIDECL